ncbi:NFACT family protein [Metallumcola ferriviriculae]|uniref:Rqc2 homolog RqcH n=1 Tax=Metallumcola ferriviriculae TaxID=3039180 RepID=A0AAU0UPE4_9FIRM|nr:NFACT family protein [Desulfitibacteraceae bacterium MK1]
MAFDGLMLHVVTKELNKELVNGRIDKIYQPTKQMLLMHIRSGRENRRLLISAASDGARLHITEDHFTNPLQPPAFCMLLRKHLEGGRIVNFEQHGLERMVSLKIAAFDEFGEPTTRILQCELMGKHSNILLLNETMQIMDSAKRFSGATNHYREVLPGLPYIPPPAQEKLDPFSLTEDMMVEMLFRVGLDKQLHRALLIILAGFSPQSCKEAVDRADLSSTITVDQCGQYEFSRLWQSLQELLQEAKNNSYQPTLIRNKDGYTAYSIFNLQHLNGEKEQLPSANQALDRYFQAKRQEQQFKELRHLLQVQTEKAMSHTSKKIAINKQKLQDASDAEQMRLFGEIITANIYQMHRGQQELTAENFYTGESVTVPLKVNFSPSENAQRYFKRYAKAKQGGKIAANFLKKATNELDYLGSIHQAISTSDSLADLREIYQELLELALIEEKNTKNKKQKKKADIPYSQPRQYLSSDEIPIMVGKNNRQNDLITLKTAKPEHLWLHVKDIPGSHVIVLSDDVPQSTLEEAALLAAYFSKAQDSANVPVDYTLVKHVRKPRGAKPGMVIYDHQKTVYATPDLSLVQSLSHK